MPQDVPPKPSKPSKHTGFRAKLWSKLTKAEEVGTSSTVPVQDNAAPQTTPNAGSRDLSYNDDLWRKAQLEAEKDPGWDEFSQDFAPNTTLVNIDVILGRFRQAQAQAEGDKWKIPVSRDGKYIVPRDAVGKVVEYANTFKEVGTTIAAADPTQHAPLAWGLVQFLVTVRVLISRLLRIG